MRLAIAAFALALLALPLSAGAADAMLPAHELLAGNHSEVEGPAHGLVRNNTDLGTLAQKLYARSLPPTLPSIDFSSHVVVYYVLPTAMRANTRVFIRGASLDHGVLRVHVELAESDSSCLGPASLTSPFAVASIALPATDVNRAEFDVTHKSYPCR